MFALGTPAFSALTTLSRNGGMPLAELAKRIGSNLSVVSRAVQQLEELQFVTTDRNRRKTVALSPSAHAQTFRSLVDLHPHVDFAPVLAHSNLRILSAFTGRALSTRKIARIIRTPEATVRRVVSELRDVGIMVRQPGYEYQIALSGLENFVQSYCRFALAEKTGSTAFVHVGPNAVLRTSEAPKPAMVLTGLSVLHQYGVALNQGNVRDYFINLFDENPVPVRLEQALVHGLVRATVQSSGRESAYVLLALHKNRGKIDLDSILQEADDFNTSNAAQEAITKIDQYGRGIAWPAPLIQRPSSQDPLWPSFEEFQQLVAQYA